MKIVIIEDEALAAKRLEKLLLEYDPGISVEKKLDSVENSVQYLQKEEAIDLIFMDIQLGDGLSFDIFEQIKVTTPVIFTTAFDQYTLKAFKVNSIDYLLKPIDEKELHLSIRKYKALHATPNYNFSENMFKLMQDLNTVKYKERLLIKRGQQLSFLKLKNTAYCFADGKLCYAVDFNGSKFLLEQTLSQLEEQVQPNEFFRINRHLLVNIEAIQKVHQWLGGRLKLDITPSATIETVVSRERVQSFKEWLGQ